MRQHLELVISFYCRFVTLTPSIQNGAPYRMYALKSKVLLLIICAVAVATVMHASVYLSHRRCKSFGGNAPSMKEKPDGVNRRASHYRLSRLALRPAMAL